MYNLRIFRIQRSFRDYLFDFETSNKWRERVIFKRVDGRLYTDDQGFDKVCPSRCMNVDEAIGVCKDRSRWHSVVSAYPLGKKA